MNRLIKRTDVEVLNVLSAYARSLGHRVDKLQGCQYQPYNRYKYFSECICCQESVFIDVYHDDLWYHCYVGVGCEPVCARLVAMR